MTRLQKEIYENLYNEATKRMWKYQQHDHKYNHISVLIQCITVPDYRSGNLIKNLSLRIVRENSEIIVLFTVAAIPYLKAIVRIF